MKKKVKEDLFSKAGIRLDIACGENCTKGWVGMDIEPAKGIDIVHDVLDIPWPLPDSCVLQAICTTLWEHIEPKHRIAFMDEIWRVMKPEGQLFMAAPYFSSFAAAQNPTHYTCPNQNTFGYFDPEFAEGMLYKVYKPKPWKLTSVTYTQSEMIEVIMEARK